MNNVQKILVLGIIVLAILGAYFLGTHKQAEAPPTNSEAPPTIDSEADNEDTSDLNTTTPTPSGRSIEIYDGITVDSNSTTLDLSGRGLTGSLKAEIRLVSKLKTLDLSDNNFTGLPAEVGQLQALEVLNLANNQFTGLPRELGNLQNLKTLDLRGNNPSEPDLAIIRKALPSATQILK